MLILPYFKKSSGRVLDEALKALKAGGVIAYPTESFYALGVVATDAGSVQRLFELKKRPADKALPIIIGDAALLPLVARSIPGQAQDFIRRFWPGPVTLIFRAAERLPRLLTGGTGMVAVRIPGAGPALDLAKKAGMPITATSANPASRPPAETVQGVADYFGEKIALIIDVGKSPGGMPSTIVDVTVVPPKILRKGRVEIPASAL